MMRPFEADCRRSNVSLSAYELNSVHLPPLQVLCSFSPGSRFAKPHFESATSVSYTSSPWRLFSANRGPCARSCRRHHPPHSARSRLPPLATTSRRALAACPTSRSSLAAALSWGKPSPCKARAPETVLLLALLVAHGRIPRA
jgi:hypothetical protein